MTDEQARRSELGERLASVRGRIAAACLASGRDPGGVTLGPITKTFPASDRRLLFGLRVGELAGAIAAEDGLLLGGVMAMAPLGVPPAQAFAPLPRIAAAVRASHPAAVIVSAGMSGDMEAAIAAGATHVRIGTALLGSRPGFVG